MGLMRRKEVGRHELAHDKIQDVPEPSPPPIYFFKVQGTLIGRNRIARYGHQSHGEAKGGGQAGHLELVPA